MQRELEAFRAYASQKIIEHDGMKRVREGDLDGRMHHFHLAAANTWAAALNKLEEICNQTN